MESRGALRTSSEKAVEYKVGMIVEHPKCPEWGLGKIVHISGETLYIYFCNQSEREAKKIRCDVISLKKANSQSDPTLDNLPPFAQKGDLWVLPGRGRRITFEQAREAFLHWFPRGFSDPDYLEKERDYKWEAHQHFVQQLGRKRAEKLLADGNVDELTRRALFVVHKVNLLSPYESAALNDAMKDPVAARAFFESLLNLLSASTDLAESFRAYAAVVCELPQKKGRVATWPVATILPFLAQPNRHMFLKPEFTQEAAERLGFGLLYDSKPNWTTYDRLLRLGRHYLSLLVESGARDFIDVQSFIWLACGGAEALAIKKAEKPQC